MVLQGENDVVSNKKEKNKGRNKNRPPPMKFQRSSKLCPVLVKISSETTDASESSNLSVNKLPTCTFPNCQFQHDVNTYLQNKVNNTWFDLCPRPTLLTILSIFVKQVLMNILLFLQPPDVGNECWIYKNYGKCEYGVACRFANSHITRVSIFLTHLQDWHLNYTQTPFKRQLFIHASNLDQHWRSTKQR